MVKQIVTGRWEENCYVVDDDSGGCIIIDPGDDYDRIAQYIESSGFTAKAIVNTHGHFDHVGAVSAIKDSYGAAFYLHNGDVKQLRRANLFGSAFDGKMMGKIPQVDVDLNHKDSVVVGSFQLGIIATPGHTRGSICLYYKGYLFTGDTLFKGAIGRTDLPGGNRVMLAESLRKISKFPLDTIICPGHGKMTTLKEELQNNSRLLEVLHEHQD